ncbi:MAG: hypothetical protein LBH44_02190 [Treponema sp.]|jgi:hypothetical protein|nr:hypothetical protein [Treponema sp.]
MTKIMSGIIVIVLLLISCENKQKSINHDITVEENGIKTIHVFVALCDNRYQNIARVPATLGNGQNQNSNLYWGALYGIRTYFKKSEEWELLSTRKMNKVILERLVFKNTQEDYYLIADAYNGKNIKQCIEDFMNSSYGNQKDAIQLDDKVLGINGNASLLAYIGHNGLMDFQLSGTLTNSDNKERDVIILACFSKRYFSHHLEAANVNPLLWTTNLMAPEAYTLHDALTGYINGETNEDIRERAAAAYAQYQKCSINAAKGLLVTDW